MIPNLHHRTRSRSYSPRGLFKNTGFIRTSFHRASFSKRNEQTLIGTDYSHDDSVEREHTTFQMVTIPTRKGVLVVMFTVLINISTIVYLLIV